jgi:nickel-dependent lactate racemase
MPGIAARETINDFHYLALVEKKSRWGNLESNPMWQDMCEVAHMVYFDVIVNVVYNYKGKIVDILWGEPEEVSKKAKATLDRMYSLELAGIADVAITSSSPLDNCLFQGLKGAFAASHFVKTGGTIILAAPCDQGLGPYTDENGINILQLDRPAILEGMKARRVNPSAAITPYLLRELLEEKKLIVVSDVLTKEELKSIGGIEHAATVYEAIENVISEHRRANVVCLPKGASMLGTSRSTAMTLDLYPEKE